MCLDRTSWLGVHWWKSLHLVIDLEAGHSGRGPGIALHPQPTSSSEAPLLSLSTTTQNRATAGDLAFKIWALGAFQMQATAYGYFCLLIFMSIWTYCLCLLDNELPRLWITTELTHWGWGLCFRSTLQWLMASPSTSSLQFRQVQQTWRKPKD